MGDPKKSLAPLWRWWWGGGGGWGWGQRDGGGGGERGKETGTQTPAVSFRRGIGSLFASPEVTTFRKGQ